LHRHIYKYKFAGLLVLLVQLMFAHVCFFFLLCVFCWRPRSRCAPHPPTPPHPPPHGPFGPPPPPVPSRRKALGTLSLSPLCFLPVRFIFCRGHGLGRDFGKLSMVRGALFPKHQIFTKVASGYYFYAFQNIASDMVAGKHRKLILNTFCQYSQLFSAHCFRYGE
jgi:hypothetical protein